MPLNCCSCGCLVNSHVVLCSVGPVSSILVNRYGSRPVVMVGGVMVGTAMVLASFGTSIMHLYLCVGVIGGTFCYFVFQITDHLSRPQWIIAATSIVFFSSLHVLLFFVMFALLSLVVTGWNKGLHWLWRKGRNNPIKYRSGWLWSLWRYHVSLNITVHCIYINMVI